MMPLPHKFWLYCLRQSENLKQWGLVVLVSFFTAAFIFLATWGIDAAVNLYHERNQLKAEAEFGRLAFREEAWKKKERERYIEEAKKTPWKKQILEAK